MMRIIEGEDGIRYVTGRYCESDIESVAVVSVHDYDTTKACLRVPAG